MSLLSARIYIYTYFSSLKNPWRKLSVSFVLRGLCETGFCDVQSGAAKNKISSRSLSLSLSAPLYLRFSLACPFSCPLPFHLLPFVSPSRFLFSPFSRVPLRTLRRGGTRGYQNAVRARSIVGRRQSPSITVASLALHYEITCLEDLFLLASSSTMSCFPANPSLSLSLSPFPPRCFSRHTILSSDVQEKRSRAAFPLHSLHRRRRRASVNLPKATEPPYSPRRSWRSRVVR